MTNIRQEDLQHDLFMKTARVIRSCKTRNQMVIALNYLALARKQLDDIRLSLLDRIVKAKVKDVNTNAI